MIYACLDRDIYIANGTTELCADNISGDLAEYFNSYFRVVSYHIWEFIKHHLSQN